MCTMTPLQQHELRITVTPGDLPEDGFSNHVNNARYFAFINRTFQSWYRAMDIRGGVPGFAAMMAHVSYDFLQEVPYPGVVLCQLRVVKVGRTSLEHAIEMWNVSAQPVLAGRGKVVHVWFDRAAASPAAWPAEVLAKCWAPKP